MSSLNVLMKINGVTGESQVDGHKGEIHLQSLNHGVSAAHSSHVGGGQSVGLASLHPMVATKTIDSTSPKLIGLVTSGKPVDSVTIYLLETTGANTGQTYAQYDLKHVIFTDHSMSAAAAGDKPSESFSFMSEDYTYGVKQQNSDGSLGGFVKHTYNVKTAKGA